MTLNFNLALIERWLLPPSKEPAYRRQRAHQDFLINLQLPAASVKATLQAAWNAGEVLSQFPLESIDRLVRKKYSTTAWNLKF